MIAAREPLNPGPASPGPDGDGPVSTFTIQPTEEGTESVIRLLFDRWDVRIEASKYKMSAEMFETAKYSGEMFRV